MNRKLWATLGFGAFVAVVLGTFIYLGDQGHPPDMPASAQHRLRFNLKNELVGVESDPPMDLAAARAEGSKYDERGAARKISLGCTACHGALASDQPAVACPNTGAPCLGEHHPPKSECIKCHRMAPR